MRKYVIPVLAFAIVGAGAYGLGFVDDAVLLSASDTSNAVDEDEVRQRFMELLNEERKSRDMQPVSSLKELREMGDGHALNMARNDYVGHEQPDGTTVIDRFKAAGLYKDWCDGGENAGALTSMPQNSGALAERIFDMWMNSPEHKALMLREETSEIGLGLAFAPGGKVYAALEMC